MRLRTPGMGTRDLAGHDTSTAVAAGQQLLGADAHQGRRELRAESGPAGAAGRRR